MWTPVVHQEVGITDRYRWRDGHIEVEAIISANGETYTLWRAAKNIDHRISWLRGKRHAVYS